MRLNADCVRDLMIACENIPYNQSEDMSFFLKQKSMEKYQREDIYYSMEKLSEAGFVEFTRFKAWGVPFDGLFTNITWEGHKFIDTIRSDTVWNKTKEKVSSSVGSASLQVLSSVASSIALKLLGL